MDKTLKKQANNNKLGVGRGVKKVSDEILWSTLMRTCGAVQSTVNLIKKEHGITIRPSSIRERIYKQPEKMAKIREITISYAENILRNLMDSKDENVRLKTVQFYLNKIGKKVGYGDVAVQLSENITSIKLVPVCVEKENGI